VAGVAHELNTPIGSAVTMASTVEDRANELHRAMESGEIKKSEIVAFVSDVIYASSVMLRGLNRAVELIGHFKQIAVDQSGEQRRRFPVDDYIEEMAATFQHLFKHCLVSLELDLKSSMTVDSYPGSLSQVVINLVQNALVHGFEDDDKGMIRISTRKKSGTEVEITVFDNGKGIKPEVVPRVFEPFFTTRLGHGGSGLGLHITYNIVSEILCGSISVESNPQQCVTQFTLVIPVNLPDKFSPEKTEIGYD